jgi:hypothetical protein
MIAMSRLSLVIGAAAIGSVSLFGHANTQPARGRSRRRSNSGASADRRIAPRQEIGITNMSTALRIFFRVPLIGWLLNDAINGAPDAKYYFVANIVLSFIVLLYAFGYAFLIAFALTATALGFVGLFALTSAGLFRTRAPRSRSAAVGDNFVGGNHVNCEPKRGE